MIVEFKSVCREAILNKDPDLVLKFIKQWWLAHLEMHGKIKLYIMDASDQYNRVD
jgi:hypothetical protein